MLAKVPFLLLTVTLFAAGTVEVAGQSGGTQGAPSSGWPPVELGARIGFDSDGLTDAFVLGGQARIPIWSTGHVEVVPGGAVAFLSQLKEYQFALDGVFVTGGRRGGLYVGGGPLWLSSIFDGPDRETQLGWSVVVGIRSSRSFGAPFGTQIQVRQSYVADLRRRRVLSLGVNFPLWGGGGSGASR
jgi:hypothetical protein